MYRVSTFGLIPGRPPVRAQAGYARLPCCCLPTALLVPRGLLPVCSNLMSQINNLDYYLPIHPGHRTLSLLPPWCDPPRVGSVVLPAGLCSSTPPGPTSLCPCP